jgi:hypothetical protein
MKRTNNFFRLKAGQWIALVMLGFALLVISACKKSFLVVPVQGQAAITAQDADSEVTAAYSALISPQPDNTFGEETHGVGFITVTNIISDDADKGSYALDQPPAADIDNFTVNSNNTYCENLWKGYYAAISRTNNAINDLPTSLMDSTIIKIRLGEMRFVRGYLYFNLVRMFGGVPLVLHPATGPNGQDSSFYSRASASDVYTQGIIPDLQYAMSALPRVQAQVGRITEGAAETLLAKVYLYQKNWQQAFNLTQDVINSGVYQLLPSYFSIWREWEDNSVESVFEIETGIYGGADNGVPEYCEFQGPRQDNGMGIPTTPWDNPGAWNPTNDGGFGFDLPTPNLVAAYEPGDLREAATIISLPANGPPDTLYDGMIIPTMVGQSENYNYKAWHSEMRNNQIEVFYGDRSHKQKNVHILRYAEVLLINAEAANELGNTSTAVIALNQVRARAGLGATPYSDQSDLRTAIWNERRVELAMEHDRFWDLVRTGRAAQVMIASGKTNFRAGVNELLPIPAQEIALSGGKLLQNLGY